MLHILVHVVGSILLSDTVSDLAAEIVDSSHGSFNTGKVNGTDLDMVVVSLLIQTGSFLTDVVTFPLFNPIYALLDQCLSVRITSLPLKTAQRT